MLIVSGGGRSGRAGSKEEPPPFLLCSSDLLEGPRHKADGPLPSGRGSPPRSLRNILASSSRHSSQHALAIWVCTSLRLVRPSAELESKGTVGKEAICLPRLSQGFLEVGLPLLLGDLKHAEALVLLQKFILGPDLLPETVQLLLLLLRAQVDAGHGADEFSHLLELGFEGIQVLMDVWAVLVHAVEGRGQSLAFTAHTHAWLSCSVPYNIF